VQMSRPQVQLHYGMSRPSSDAARKCHTAQHYIFKILIMLTTFKKN
jgi:hypothetical protein